ncbi:MAG: hypothetical protein FJ104_01955 [Deltaproteobacteria bacterium]|nr:hypothetical protein [Deltaproteobacteria bacterium]
MVIGRRVMLGGLSGLAAALAMPAPAAASVAVALPLAEMVRRSRHVLVGRPIDAQSRWETVGRRSRIVTYSLVRVEQGLEDDTPAGEVLVRSLGGAVGDIGQIVHGEAVLALGEPAAVFLSELDPSVFAVTAMSQGHFPVAADAAGVARLRAGVTSLELLAAAGGAVQRLQGRSVPEAESLVRAERARAH